MRQKLLQCLQIKSLPSTGGSVLRTSPASIHGLQHTWRKIRRCGAERACDIWSAVCQIHRMVRVCTCSRKKRTLKHKSNKSGDQSFFYVQLSCSVPAASWATQAQSLISMWSLTWTRHHAVNMKGYANTQALSHVRSILSKKRARNTKTNNPHAAAPSHSALLLCSKNSIHLNNGEEEKCQH